MTLFCHVGSDPRYSAARRTGNHGKIHFRGRRRLYGQRPEFLDLLPNMTEEGHTISSCGVVEWWHGTTHPPGAASEHGRARAPLSPGERRPSPWLVADPLAARTRADGQRYRGEHGVFALLDRPARPRATTNRARLACATGDAPTRGAPRWRSPPSGSRSCAKRSKGAPRRGSAGAGAWSPSG